MSINHDIANITNQLEKVFPGRMVVSPEAEGFYYLQHPEGRGAFVESGAHRVILDNEEQVEKISMRIHYSAKQIGIDKQIAFRNSEYGEGTLILDMSQLSDQILGDVLKETYVQDYIQEIAHSKAISPKNIKNASSGELER